MRNETDYLKLESSLELADDELSEQLSLNSYGNINHESFRVDLPMRNETNF